MLLQHPVTTEYGQEVFDIDETIAAVQRLKMQTVWLWPNIDAGSDNIAKRLRQLANMERDFPLRLYRNLDIHDYARLISNSMCLVGNSSSGIREAAFLGLASVNIGTRQSGRERGDNVIDTPNDREKIFAAIKTQISRAPIVRDFRFGDGHSGKKIADVLATVEPNIQKKMSY